MNLKNAIKAAACALLIAGPVFASDTGTRIVVRPTSTATKLPKPDQLAESLVVKGDSPHQVQVRKEARDGQPETLTLDLWGPTIASSENASTLRAKFPELASATIDVSTLAASEKPKFEDLEAKGEGKKRFVKKKVIHEEKKQ